MSDKVNKREFARTQGKYDSRATFHQEAEQRTSRDDGNNNRSTFKQKSRGRGVDYPDCRYESPPRERRANSILTTGGEDNVVFYEDPEDQSFPELEEPLEPEEISTAGSRVLSETENGESRIYYNPSFIDPAEGYNFLEKLKSEVKWHTKNILIRGIEYPQPRLVAWFGPLPYTYSGVTLEAKELPDTVLKIKVAVEEELNKQGIKVELNSVLLNLYRDNRDSVSWHSDDEESMGIRPTIASVSLGEVRRFEMKRKFSLTGTEGYADCDYFVRLKHGSLIVMDGVMQDDWLHRVPKEYHDKSERINLTFRTVYPLERVQRMLPSVTVGLERRAVKVNQPFEYDEDSFPSLNDNAVHPEKKKHLDTEKSSGELEERESKGRVTPEGDAVVEKVEESCSENLSMDWAESGVRVPRDSPGKARSQSPSKEATQPEDLSGRSRRHKKVPVQSSSVSQLDNKVKKYDVEIGRLFSLYDHITKRWEEIPFTNRDREELNVLIPVVENADALPLEIIVSIADRIEKLLRRVENYGRHWRTYPSPRYEDRRRKRDSPHERNYRQK